MGYGATEEIKSAYMGDLSDRWAVPISELFNKPLDYNADDGAPIWIKSTAGTVTPMTKHFIMHMIFAMIGSIIVIIMIAILLLLSILLMVKQQIQDLGIES